MENMSNIMEMLSEIEHSLLELTRRVSSLEGRRHRSRPAAIDYLYNLNPYNQPTQTYGLYGNNPRGPYGGVPERQYNMPYPQNMPHPQNMSYPQNMPYPQYKLNPHDNLDATRHARQVVENLFQQTPIYNNSNSYKPYINVQIDPIIIDIIVDALTIVHKVNLTVFEKNALNKLKTLKFISEDIYNHVIDLHAHVTQYDSTPEISMRILTVITEMMRDRGYMKDVASKVETTNNRSVNSGENIKWNNQDSNIKKPTNNNVDKNKFDIIESIMNVDNRLLDILSYTRDQHLNKDKLIKCVNLLNDYLMLNYSQLNTAKEITSNHTTCKYLVNDLSKLLDSYNVPNTYKFGTHISNLDMLTVALDKLIKDYNIISILNLDKAPVVNKSNKQSVRKR